SSGLRELAQSPLCVLGDDRIGILGESDECGYEFFFAAVSHRNYGVAPQTRELRAADWRVSKHAAKFLLLHLRQPVERGIDESLARLKFRGGSAGRFPIPRTDILADIATENMPAHLCAQAFVNVATLFDGEIGNAEPRIELSRCDEG